MESAVAVHIKGRCLRLQCCTKSSILCTSSFTLRKEPRRMARCVIKPNQRSTDSATTSRWGVVHVEARPLRKPSAHLGMLVGGVIVHDQVDIQFGGNTGLQAAQERQELLMTMAGLALGKDSTRSNIQGSE